MDEENHLKFAVESYDEAVRMFKKKRTWEKDIGQIKIFAVKPGRSLYLHTLFDARKFFGIEKQESLASHSGQVE